MSGITRPMSRMRKMDTKENLFRARKRSLKYLVHAYLKQEGCFQTADCFVTEADLSDEYEVCDNIDLDIILQEYCSYYLMRFDKPPQFCKKVDVDRPRSKQGPKRTPCCTTPLTVDEPKKPDLPSSVMVKRLLNEEHTKDQIPTIERKSLASFLSSTTPETKSIAELLYQDIRKSTTDVSWKDVIGLDNAKSILIESVILPAKIPEVFKGALEPWKGVLLHGPPGTGKTMLAKAVANESGSTFFNVCCSTVVNKFRGESEKILKVLFDMASYYAPSVVFIDEVESLVSDRSCPGEHEASRRFKAQFLTELDGIASREGRIFLLVNSNMPWDIDPAMLRRLEKRIYIPLPDAKTRVELFKTYLTVEGRDLTSNIDLKIIADKTEDYSGSDIRMVCKEALMATVRQELPNMNINKGWPNIRREKLELHHLLTAVTKTKPVGKNLAQKHINWQNNMGSC